MAITPSNYSYRQLITGAAPPATNSGQVLRIDENSVDASFFTSVQNGGGDIRVCEDSAGTLQLPIEVLECDNVGNTLKVWTRKPTYSSASRDVYIFCGTTTTDTQPAVTDTFGRNNVYQDYACVLPLNDPASVIDVSGNITSGITISGSPAGTRQVFGQDVIDFDGVNDAIGLGVNVIPAGTTNATIQAIIRPDAAATNNTAIFSNDATRGYAVWFDNSGFSSGNTQIISAGCDLTDTLPNRIETATNSILPNTDYHVVFREDGGGGSTQRDVFINGSTAGATVQTGATGFDAVAPVRTDAIGGNTGANGWTALNFFNGGIGEFRARLDTLSDSFIETEYANISNTSTFWTQSTPDNPSGGGASQPITLIAAMQGETAQAVPITKAALISAVQAAQNETAASVAIEQIAAQAINSVAAIQGETAQTLNATQRLQLATVIAQQLETAQVQNITNVQAVSFIAAKQSETASAINVEQFTGQVVTLIAAQQGESAQTVLISQIANAQSVFAQQSETATTAIIEQSQSLNVIEAQQLEYAQILNIIHSEDNTDLSGLVLIPITETYSLTPLEAIYTLEEI